jgi:hypothetical protein
MFNVIRFWNYWNAVQFRFDDVTVFDFFVLKYFINGNVVNQPRDYDLVASLFIERDSYRVRPILKLSDEKP